MTIDQPCIFRRAQDNFLKLSEIRVCCVRSHSQNDRLCGREKSPRIPQSVQSVFAVGHGPWGTGVDDDVNVIVAGLEGITPGKIGHRTKSCAKKTTRTCSKSNVVCKIHAWVSIPHKMMDLLSVVSTSFMSSGTAAMEKQVLANGVTPNRSSSNSGTVGPRPDRKRLFKLMSISHPERLFIIYEKQPFGYCSVANIGTFMRWAACEIGKKIIECVYLNSTSVIRKDQSPASLCECCELFL